MHCFQSMARITAMLLGLALGITGCARPADELSGEWRGVGADGQRFVLILKPDHSYRIISGNQAIDASMYQDMGMRWESDEGHDPKRLTLSATEGDTTMRIPVIYNLLDGDRLVIKFGVTPRGESIAWDQLNWDSKKSGGDHVVLERAPITQ